jgi:2-succinyl-6-hydroxy-2,4-cyclohexadiene-1-carboxylate synthase
MDINLHYRCMGEGDDAPLVLLHGFMGSGADWDAVAKRLGKQRQCMLVDLPGHGQSALPADDFGFDETARALADAVKREWTGPVDLLGYSLGGRVALYAVLRAGLCVRRLMLESASPGIEGDAERVKRKIADEERAARLERDGLDAFLGAWYRQPLFASLAQTRQSEDAGVRDGWSAMMERRRQNNPEALAWALRRLSPGLQPSLWPELRKLHPPLLCVAGEHDEKYRKVAARAAAEAPLGRCVVIVGAGHAVHLERPEAFVGAVEDFLHEQEHEHYVW